MSEQETGWETYPADGVALPEKALFEVWDRLEKFREELVVVGGLAVHYHTRGEKNPFYPSAPTLDVDFGISLGTDGGMKGSVEWDLNMAGYQNVDDRMVKVLDDGRKLYIDFLTEHPPRETGTRNVSDVIASICPGINRALEEREYAEICGMSHCGEERTYRVPICGIGPLLVLKLNAFAERENDKKAKDAYDILSVVSSYSGGAAAAIESFQKEKSWGNPAMAKALATLAENFQNRDALAPKLAEAFRFGSARNTEFGLRLRNDLAYIGQALLGE